MPIIKLVGNWIQKCHYLKISFVCIAGLADKPFTKICRMETAKKLSNAQESIP
jgi:hypothetical protein